MTAPRHRGALIAAGALLGMGLGGFVDGILLHQILQWHNVLSSRVEPKDLATLKYNMVWDGIFHAFTWVMTCVGLGLLWSAGRRADVPWSGKTFCGSLVLGWGLFNFVEGVLDHQIFGLHHVHPGNNQLEWDLGFLIFGFLLIAAGASLIWRARHDDASRQYMPRAWVIPSS